jgi:hypothetical protein
MKPDDVKFTPGPYLRDGRTVYAREHHGWNKGEETFRNRFSANVQGIHASDEELEAVAALFAAAPALYEAIRALMDLRYRGMDETAIARAFGVVEMLCVRDVRAALSAAQPRAEGVEP